MVLDDFNIKTGPWCACNFSIKSFFMVWGDFIIKTGPLWCEVI